MRRKALHRRLAALTTQTGAFTAHFGCTIARSDTFTLGSAHYRLGKPGDHFEVAVSGHLNQQGPPSAHIAGFITRLAPQ